MSVLAAYIRPSSHSEIVKVIIYLKCVFVEIL